MRNRKLTVFWGLLLLFTVASCQKTPPVATVEISATAAIESAATIEAAPTITATATLPLPAPTASPRPVAPLPTGETFSIISIDYQNVTGQSPLEYGTNGWWTDQDADLWRARYAQLGGTLVRIPALQGMLEPQNDDDDPQHINWQGFMFDQPLPWFGRTVTFRRQLAALNDEQMTIMLYVPYLSGWLSANGDKKLFSTYPPNDLAEYREYLRALLTFVVDEAGYPPERVILEPVNEPDLGCGRDRNVSCFWENWQLEDLAAVMRAADDVAAAVDPAIRIVGVAECCGTELAERLVAEYDGQSWLDGFSYHRYIHNFDFSDGLARGARLAAYGKLVYLNEYGNTRYWSNGPQGALWHALILPQIWRAGINPVQFPISEFPGSHEGYEQLGLFKDWENDWQLKPAYWVYSNFYRHFGGSELLSTTETPSLFILAGRKELAADGPMLAIWLVNKDREAPTSLRFEAAGFPADAARVQVYDNLQGDQPVSALDAAGSPLSFELTLPPASSYLLVVRP